MHPSLFLRWVAKILCFQSFWGEQDQKHNCKGRIGCVPLFCMVWLLLLNMRQGISFPFYAPIHITFMCVLNENKPIWFSHFSSLKTGEHTWVHPHVEQAIKKTFPRRLKNISYLDLFNITSGWRDFQSLKKVFKKMSFHS